MRIGGGSRILFLARKRIAGRRDAVPVAKGVRQVAPRRTRPRDPQYRVHEETVVLWIVRGTQNQAIGRSRGGLTSKVHIAVDGLGNPLRFILTGGQVGDVTHAEGLIAGLPGEYLLADTAYDADHFRARLDAAGMAAAVIPSNPSRAQAIPLDAELYKERHLVECFINKIKHFRRIATRYEKTAIAYLAMLCLVGAIIWLR